MAKCLWQITDYLKENNLESEFDKDSQTLFINQTGKNGEIQTRYYYDDNMEILSCQAIFTEQLIMKNKSQLFELLNLCNSQLGFGSFLIIEEGDLVFEINQLYDPVTPLTDSVIEKLVLITFEALDEHLPIFKEVANGANAEKTMNKFFD